MGSYLADTLLIEPLVPGDAGAVQTVGHMRTLVDAYRADPMARAAVLDALAGVAEQSPRDDVSALLVWTRRHTRFLRDPHETEYVQTPGRMLTIIRRGETASGDCDDLAVLFATLVESAGYPTRFAVSGPDGEDFSHVTVEVDLDGVWVSVDPSQRGTGLGYRPSLLGRRGREMRYGVGQDEEAIDWAAAETGYVSGGLIPYTAPPEDVTAATTPVGGGWSWQGFLDSISGVVKTAAPLLERYGVVKPIAGYTATGQPIYAGQVAPVGGVQGAAWSALTQPGPLGLSMGAWLLIGGGAVLVLMTRRGRR